MSRDNLTKEGEIGEMRVQLDLTLKGGVVSVPLTASTNGYDLLCDFGAKILKIQVKAVKKTERNTISVPLQNRKNSSVAKNNRGQTHRYKDLVDFIAVPVKNDKRIFYIDTNDLPDTGASETFLLPEYEGASKKTRLCEKRNNIK
tara:strand:- start:369 stop:803 length:435 start_codon:yes stop_codon:yes gene_type:complete